MATLNAAQMWSLNYRVLTSVIISVAPEIEDLGIELKDVFLLAEVDAHPHPAELAVALLMPKPTVTVTVKRLEASGFLRREIDAKDLRKHRLTLTAAGRKAGTRALQLLSEAYGKRLSRLTNAEQSTLSTLLEKLA